ncbi:MAG: Hsp20/alpha crystallin family protein [Candidatus Dormibacteraeota bacterium]|nr:Hsp20/alpha crystallin family protein [Candidatus Dormibacteraeota bacterium]
MSAQEASDATPAVVPPVNVYESGGQLSVAVPLPGAHPEQIRLLLRPDRLELEAQGKYPQESQNYLRKGWTVGRTRLDLDLPRRVAPEKAHATLNLGVLVLMAPISESGQGEQVVAVEIHHPAVPPP